MLSLYHYGLITDSDSGTSLPDVVELTYIDISIPNLAVYSGYTLSQCQSACSSTVGCEAFTINCAAGSQCGGASTYQCYLKSALGTSNIYASSPAVTLVDLNGQYAPIVGVDFHGNDITSLYGTTQDCIAACDSTMNCGMFTILVGSYPITATTTYPCYLKTNTSIDWSFNDGYQSYVMPTTTISGINSMFACVPCAAGE